MRFKISTVSHPEHTVLKKWSKGLALLWGIGHTFFVVFLAMALAAPTGVVILGIMDPDVTKEHVWDVAISSMGAALFIAAVGFTLKWYASKKGRDAGAV